MLRKRRRSAKKDKKRGTKKADDEDDDDNLEGANSRADEVALANALTAGTKLNVYDAFRGVAMGAVVKAASTAQKNLEDRRHHTEASQLTQKITWVQAAEKINIRILESIAMPILTANIQLLVKYQGKMPKKWMVVLCKRVAQDFEETKQWGRWLDTIGLPAITGGAASAQTWVRGGVNFDRQSPNIVTVTDLSMADMQNQQNLIFQNIILTVVVKPGRKGKEEAKTLITAAHDRIDQGGLSEPNTFYTRAFYGLLMKHVAYGEDVDALFSEETAISMRVNASQWWHALKNELRAMVSKESSVAPEITSTIARLEADEAGGMGKAVDCLNEWTEQAPDLMVGVRDALEGYLVRKMEAEAVSVEQMNQWQTLATKIYSKIIESLAAARVRAGYSQKQADVEQDIKEKKTKFKKDRLDKVLSEYAEEETLNWTTLRAAIEDAAGEKIDETANAVKVSKLMDAEIETHMVLSKPASTTESVVGMVEAHQRLLNMLPMLVASQEDMPSKGRMHALTEGANVLRAARKCKEAPEVRNHSEVKVKLHSNLKLALMAFGGSAAKAGADYDAQAKNLRGLRESAQSIQNAYENAVVSEAELEGKAGTTEIVEFYKNKDSWRSMLGTRSKDADYQQAAEKSGIMSAEFQLGAKELITKFDQFILHTYPNLLIEHKRAPENAMVTELKASLVTLKALVAEGKVLDHVRMKARKKDLRALQDNIASQTDVKKAMGAKVRALTVQHPILSHAMCHVSYKTESTNTTLRPKCVPCA